MPDLGVFSKKTEVRCPLCNSLIGYSVEFFKVPGVKFLMAGGIVARKVNGHCLTCKNDFYWSINDLKFINSATTQLLAGDL